MRRFKEADQLVVASLTLTRLHWLWEMAKAHGRTIEEEASAIVHAATLDFQRDNFPASTPDMVPVEAEMGRYLPREEPE